MVGPRDGLGTLVATCRAGRALGAVVCGTAGDAAADVTAGALAPFRPPSGSGLVSSSTARPVSTKSTSTTTATRTCELLGDLCSSSAAWPGRGAIPGLPAVAWPALSWLGRSVTGGPGWFVVP